MPARRRPSDPIRDMVLRSVQHHLVSERNNPPPMLPAPDNVTDISSFVLKPNMIRVRVSTTDQGLRQFTIRVSEDRP